MSIKDNKTFFAAAVAYTLNMLLNLFWAVIGFGPLSYFCYNYMYNRWFYIFLGISLVGYMIPDPLLHRLRLSHSTHFYRKTGVRLAQKLTQDGGFVNRALRKKFPKYGLAQDEKTLKKHLNKGYMNEKFHLMMFIFFLLSSVYALVLQMFLWSLVITVTNIIFNVYPVLLQQYNRLRIMKLMERFI